MKNFFHKHSYDIVKTFVFHLVVGMFALTAISVVGASSESAHWWNITLSVIITLFYMFLIYGEMWKEGDKEAVEHNPGPMYSGILIGLAGSAVDFVLAAMKLCIYLFGQDADSLYWLKGTFTVVNFVYNGMFRGIMNIPTGSSELFSHWWVYLFTCVPAIIACGLGYYLGRRGLHLTKLFVYENPEEKELKKEQIKRRKEERDD